MSRQLTAIRHLDTDTIRALIDDAGKLKESVVSGKEIRSGKARSIGLLFFENSTRTRVSFEQAASHLGYRVVNFSGSGSSLSKGESLKDTILTLKNEGLEGLVMRHKASGSAALGASYFGGPFVSAGDGQHEHPTQALGDALTIKERLGKVEGLKIAIVGDVLHSRVARSNAWLLSKLGNEVRFVGPRSLIPAYTAKLPGEVHYDLRSGIAGADVVMCLRLQRERMEDGRLSSTGEFSRNYQINRVSMRAAHPDAIIMHPGPINRGIELDDLAADAPNSAILDQVANGVFVRMAALKWVFEGEKA
ncbi:MAG: aspartate carbamoyltransferase catalytic subunit [Armatimonadetes bacterium]|nr:aspartate carbamoyltransferase catalytic subunit [Armatimonadota bacterium]